MNREINFLIFFFFFGSGSSINTKMKVLVNSQSMFIENNPKGGYGCVHMHALPYKYIDNYCSKKKKIIFTIYERIVYNWFELDQFNSIYP